MVIGNIGESINVALLLVTLANCLLKVYVQTVDLSYSCSSATPSEDSWMDGYICVEMEQQKTINCENKYAYNSVALISQDFQEINYFIGKDGHEISH